MNERYDIAIIGSGPAGISATLNAKKGCYAAGDIVGAPYQYIKAAGEGNIAALSAVSYIEQIKRKNKEV